MTNYVIVTGIYLSIMSIVLANVLAKSVSKLNNKQFYTDINNICGTYFVMLIVNILILPNIFKIDYSLHIFPKILIPNIIAVLVYLNTTTECHKKIYDANASETPQKSPTSRFAAIIIAIPLIIFSLVTIREYCYIHNSDVLIVYCYDYDDHLIFGTEDSGWYACAISDSYCKKVDFGSLSTMKLLMSKKMTIINDEDSEEESTSNDSRIGEYNIYYYGNDEYIVYKNFKKIGSFTDYDPWIADREKHYGYIKEIFIRQSN